MSKSNKLPAGFECLERFVGGWAVFDSMKRWEKRLASTMPEVREFYDVMLPVAEDAMKLLAKKNVEDLTEAERNLYGLSLSFMTVSPAVEIYGSPTLADFAFDHQRMDIRQLIE